MEAFNLFKNMDSETNRNIALRVMQHCRNRNNKLHCVKAIVKN
jgi:hypothetical protein